MLGKEYPVTECSEQDAAEEVAGGMVVADCDAPAVLEATGEALAAVAQTVEGTVEDRPRPAASGGIPLARFVHAT